MAASQSASVVAAPDVGAATVYDVTVIASVTLRASTDGHVIATVVASPVVVKNVPQLAGAAIDVSIPVTLVNATNRKARQFTATVRLDGGVAYPATYTPAVSLTIPPARVVSNSLDPSNLTYEW